MKKVKLGDVATYINGYAFKPSDWGNEGKPIIRIQDLTGTAYQTNRYNGEIDKKYEVANGDVLISWSASLGVYIWEREDALLNQHIFKVLFNKVEVDKMYFFYQLMHLLENVGNETHGSTMKHLTKPVFDNLSFLLPALNEQKQIVDKLNKLSCLIEKRKLQLEKLDLLVKSQFIEKFGRISEAKFPTMALSDICEFIKDGTHQTPTYTDDQIGGFKFLSSKDVTSGVIDWSKIKYIPKELHDELYARICPKRGDILLAKNGTIGIAALIETDDVFDIYVSLALLRIKEGYNGRYLLSAINSDDVNRQFNESIKGIGVPNLHLGEIKKTKVIIPSIEYQNEFARFAEQTDKLKFTIKRSLEKLETLKKALMQKYFG